MKNEKGITLIALIITIIIMLILVAVSISILINSGLIGKAKEAGSKTKTAYEEESKMGDSINIDGQVYNSIDEYINTSDDEEYEEYEGKQKLHIKNYDELLEFANRVNDGETFEDYVVFLDSDIEMQDENWIIIGTIGGREDPPNCFQGIFEGKNHTISNLRFSSSLDKVGLFRTNQGIIKNLNVEGEYESENSVGTKRCGVISYVNNGTISNCNVEINCNGSIGQTNFKSGIGRYLYE